MNKKDTSKQANEVLVGICRQMTPAVKTMYVFEAYQTGKILAMTGLKEFHPDAGEKQIWRLWAKRHLGEKLFNAAYGDLCDE